MNLKFSQMKLKRRFFRILNFKFIFLGGILAMSACSPPMMSDADFEKLCKEEAYVKVLDPILWERYVKLATANSARIDRKPTFVAMDGFTVLSGKNRETMTPSFPVGIHDLETAVLYDGTEIAILYEKVRTVETFNGLSSFSCYWISGLEMFIENRNYGDRCVIPEIIPPLIF